MEESGKELVNSVVEREIVVQFNREIESASRKR